MNRMRLERLKRDMTQREIADKLEISRYWYILIESGREKPSADIAKRLRAVYHMPLRRMFKAVRVQSG